jgi:nitroreductase
MRYWVGAESLPLSRQLVAELARAAMMAPSIHKSLPWRIHVSPERQTIELHSNPDHGLEFSDPTGRIVHVACGAAVFNLRLAAATAGRDPMVVLLPEPAAPSLLATIRLAGSHLARPVERELHAAMTASHAGLDSSAGDRVPDAVLAELADAACTEGTNLRILHNPEAALLLTRTQTAEPSVAAFVNDSPQLAVLAAPTGSTAGSLRAGQAMERLLLTATARGIAAKPFVTLPGSSAWQGMREHFGIEQPQMILGFGCASALPDDRTELLTSGLTDAPIVPRQAVRGSRQWA